MWQLNRSRKGMHSALSWPMPCSLPLQQGLGQQYAGVLSLLKSPEDYLQYGNPGGWRPVQSLRFKMRQCCRTWSQQCKVQ